MRQAGLGAATGESQATSASTNFGLVHHVTAGFWVTSFFCLSRGHKRRESGCYSLQNLLRQPWPMAALLFFFVLPLLEQCGGTWGLIPGLKEDASKLANLGRRRGPLGRKIATAAGQLLGKFACLMQKPLACCRQQLVACLRCGAACKKKVYKLASGERNRRILRCIIAFSSSARQELSKRHHFSHGRWISGFGLSPTRQALLFPSPLHRSK